MGERAELPERMHRARIRARGTGSAVDNLVQLRELGRWNTLEVAAGALDDPITRLRPHVTMMRDDGQVSTRGAATHARTSPLSDLILASSRPVPLDRIDPNHTILIRAYHLDLPSPRLSDPGLDETRPIEDLNRRSIRRSCSTAVRAGRGPSLPPWRDWGAGPFQQ